MAAPASNRFASLAVADDTIDGATTGLDSHGHDESHAKPLQDPIFWVDLEMTGLDPMQHTILEVAVIASDGALQRLIEGPSLVIHHEEDVLSAMNEWSKKQHAQSGLIERCRASSLKLSEAEAKLMTFFEAHKNAHPAVLGGACVYKDLEFIGRRMPMLRELLSHRVVDVSTIRELARRWTPAACRGAPRSTVTHRALDDIKYSIEECRYYRECCWRPDSSPASGSRRVPGRSRGGRSGNSRGGNRTASDTQRRDDTILSSPEP